MKHQVFNPYLPSWEYIPDGEPHIFGDRVYVYGSHDSFNAPIFCTGDYMCWSAPVDDLSDWQNEGVIFKKNQDPKNKLGLRLLFAPDVCQGPDGRYYLYYAFDFMAVLFLCFAGIRLHTVAAAVFGRILLWKLLPFVLGGKAPAQCRPRDKTHSPGGAPCRCGSCGSFPDQQYQLCEPQYSP